MNLVVYLILKLLSRPVVCANFHGLEENTFFPDSGVNQGHSSDQCIIIYLKVIGKSLLWICITRPGRPQKFSFSKILEVVSRPEFVQDHESGFRSDRGPILYWRSDLCALINY
jgi:hypothetical protein